MEDFVRNASLRSLTFGRAARIGVPATGGLPEEIERGDSRCGNLPGQMINRYFGCGYSFPDFIAWDRASLFKA